MDQTGNNTNTTDPALQNNTFEFYFPLPNDIRIYHIMYTELDSTEIARILNNRIDLSHIPDNRFPHHYNVQHLIRQQIIQRTQQNIILRHPFHTMENQSIFQEYSDNSACDTSSIPPIQQFVDYQQDIFPQQSFEFYLPLPDDVHIYHVRYTELNSMKIARLLNNKVDLSPISDHQLPYHCNIQRLIRQQIQQPVGYQLDTIPLQSFDTMDTMGSQPTFQEYSDDNAYDLSSIPFIQPFDYQQDTIPQQFFDTTNTFQDNNAYNATPNSPEDNNGV
ncbi:hypothetical protein RclHR1_08200005 [Rhizophagus clarus]|uniref:Uncharacterized protein n=1 Tax=Rhizophagus clarus TaxID=94130 RepID=A0A2Z6S6N5_9GLOM|nr:hypothetical protein RclHR1_08200005 [Rhizophagus clarus]GES99362.1 hypothetical protein GLOIN_2v1802091 [Rhizophagus clarus]